MLLEHVVQRTQERLSSMDRTKLLCAIFIVVGWIFALTIDESSRYATRTQWVIFCNTIFWGYLFITESDDTQ